MSEMERGSFRKRDPSPLIGMSSMIASVINAIPQHPTHPHSRSIEALQSEETQVKAVRKRYLALEALEFLVSSLISQEMALCR